MISSKTPFWTTCLNDPLEFIQHIFFPILMKEPEKGMFGTFRERISYQVKDGHANVPTETVGDINADTTIELQILNLSSEEIDSGRWLTSPETSFTTMNDFSDSIAYKTKDTWEFNGTTNEFIQHKDTP